MTDESTRVDPPAVEPERGFMIREKFYPFPTSYRIADPVLVRELSGLPWDPFIAAATGDEEWIQANEAPDETLVLVALIGCAVWHVRSDWPRAAVVRFVQGLDEEEIELVGVDEPEVSPGEADPSATTETTTTGATPALPRESEEPQV